MENHISSMARNPSPYLTAPPEFNGAPVADAGSVRVNRDFCVIHFVSCVWEWEQCRVRGGFCWS